MYVGRIEAVYLSQMCRVIDPIVLHCSRQTVVVPVCEQANVAPVCAIVCQKPTLRRLEATSNGWFGGSSARRWVSRVVESGIHRRGPDETVCTHASVLVEARGTTEGVVDGVDASERFCAARNQPAVAPGILRPRLCLMGSSRRGCAKVSRKPFGDRRFWTGGRVAAVVGLVFGASIPHRIAGPLNPDAEEHAQEPPGSHGTRAALTLSAVSG